MVERKVHIVGSVPLADAEAVFTTLSAALSPHLRSMPDGETGERLDWITWLEPAFAGNPAFEPAPETFKTHASGTVSQRYRLKPGVAAGAVRFDDLFYADVARQSYAVFARLKREGRVAPHLKFQVDIAPAHSTCRRFLVDGDQGGIETIFDHALEAEIAKIVAAIPAAELAIQLDVASAVFARLQTGEPTRYGETKAAMMETFATRMLALSDLVPVEVDLFYHLCYGDNNHKHVVEPSDLADCVAFANRIAAGSVRPVQLFHMPVPRDRADAAYFAPLAGLTLASGSRLSLGLVHFSDGVAGTRRRLAAAEPYARDFLVATECGFGRRDPATIPELLRTHAEIAAG